MILMLTIWVWTCIHILGRMPLSFFVNIKKWLHHRCWFRNDVVFGCRFMIQKRHSFWLPISESAAPQFLAANLWFKSNLVDCRFLNRQWHSLAADLWVSSGAVLVVDFWIGSGTVWLLIYESTLAQFSLLISESATIQYVAVDFWIGNDTVKPNKKN